MIRSLILLLFFGASMHSTSFGQFHAQSFPDSLEIESLSLKTILIGDTTKDNSKPVNCYNHQKAALFCRLESKIERKSKIPVRLRIGEVSEVDRKEEKFSMKVK